MSPGDVISSHSGEKGMGKNVLSGIIPGKTGMPELTSQ